MNYAIIGTAGHVDHGKTSLIKALSGIETDRLKEEKKRGITIDLGFAYMAFEDGFEAGIIDVPGHEKFIKNMLAGASGIDLVLMVIAADEGIMPQTKEHIDILTLLGAKNGIVVLTKSDMVEAEWLEFVKEEVSEKLQETFLQDSPIVAVSSQNMQGIDELKKLIFQKLKEQDKKEEKDFRLPIDRVFSVEGFGAVITGTSIEGKLNVGDSVMIYPSQLESKARNIQVHSKDVKTAFSGQRTAVNLANIKKTDIKRGDILALKNTVAVSDFIDVKIKMLKDTKRSLKNNSLVHFHHGSNEFSAKVTLLGCDELKSGESSYAQIRCQEKFALKANDPFVIRFISPLETIGGGKILNTISLKRKRVSEEAKNAVEILENGSESEKIAVILRDYNLISVSDIAIRLNIAKSKIKTICLNLAAKKEILEVSNELFMHKNEIERIKCASIIFLKEFHKANPLKHGIKREELRTRLRPNMQIAYMDKVLDELIAQKTLKESDFYISLQEFKIVVNEDLQQLRAKILKEFELGKFSPLTPNEIALKFPNVKNIQQIYSKMITDGDLVRLNEKIYMAKSAFDEAVDKIKTLESKKGEIVLADVRDVLDNSRKFALSLLEYLDNKKITLKNGDARKFLK